MHLFAYACFIFTVSSPPPYSPVDPEAAADYTAAEYDYVVDAQPLATALPGKQCPFTSPTYRLSVFNYSMH